MKKRSALALGILVLCAVPILGTTAACSDGGEAVAEQGSAVQATDASATAVDDEGVIDLGCPPEPTSCPSEGPLSPVETESAPDDAFRLRPMADAKDAANFVDKCKAALAAATEKTAKAVKVCVYTIAVCGALVGNGNGTEIQKFCEAAAKVVNCKGKAEEEGRKLQDEVCKSKCSTSVACADAGADSGTTTPSTPTPAPPKKK